MANYPQLYKFTGTAKLAVAQWSMSWTSLTKLNSELMKSVACQVIRDYGEVVIYIDGSATGGSKDGGAVMAATRCDVESPDVICKEERRGAAFTSFKEEKEAYHIGFQ